MENDTTGKPLPDLSGMLSKIMANPDAVAMLSSLLGNQMPKAPQDEKSNEKTDDETQACSLPVPKAKENPTREKRRRLLLALKPFLSPERCSAIDRILMITDAMSLLQSEKRM